MVITHNRYTLVNRNAGPLIDLAVERGMAVLNAAPYAGGALAKGAEAFARYVYQEASEATLGPIGRVETICARHGVPPGAAALQFSLRDPRIAGDHLRREPSGARRPDPGLGRLADRRGGLAGAARALPFAIDDPEATRVYNPG